MCQTVYISTLNSRLLPSSDANVIHTTIRRSDGEIREFRVKMLTHGEAEKMINLINSIENFRLNKDNQL